MNTTNSNGNVDDDNFSSLDDNHDLIAVEELLGLNLHFQLLYRLDKKLGKGGFGTVWSATPTFIDTTSSTDGQHEQEQEKYAVKIMDLTTKECKAKTPKQNQKDIKQVYQEVKILKQLQHIPNIVPYVDFIVEPRRFYVVLGYAKGGDLFDFLRCKKKFTEKDARDIIITLLTALQHIHSKPHYIVHRDLKPENLLLSERPPNEDVDDDDDARVRRVPPPSSTGTSLRNSIYIADFGFAKQLPYQRRKKKRGYLKTRLGTPSFIAPEIVLGSPYQTGVDMWSMGCILYMLMCGYPPFQGNREGGGGERDANKDTTAAQRLKPLFYQIRAGDYTFHDSHWKKISIPCKRLISRLLRVNPKLRNTAKQALESEWILDIDDESLSIHDISESLRRNQSTGATTANTTETATTQGISSNIIQPMTNSQRNKLAWKGAMQAVKFARSAKFWNPNVSTFPSIQQSRWRYTNIQNMSNSVLPPVPPSLSSSATATGTTPTGPTVQFRDVYTIQKKIMEGSTAIVYQCEHVRTKELYAVKIISRRQRQQKMNSPQEQRDDHDHDNVDSYIENHDNYVLNEVAIMQSLSEYGKDYVVHVIDFYESPEHFYIVMDLMDGGDVLDRLYQGARYTEEDAKQLIKRLLEAVSCMHSLGIAHRDLKPQNLLLTSKDNDASIKVADFGFSARVHTPESLVSRCGTPTYVAPEILKNIPHDERCDLWSVGVIVYILLVGYPPFVGENQLDLFKKIRTGDYRFFKDHWKDVSDDAQKLVRGLLVVDPDQRWTAKEALRCAWIQDAPDLSHVDLDNSLRSLRERRERVRQFSKAVVWKSGEEASNTPIVSELKIRNFRR